jgi:hypothetical protein
MLQKHRTSVDICKGRREEKYIIRKKKMEYENQKCEAEKLYTAKEIREFYQNTNNVLCKDKRGNIPETPDILKRRPQYFEEAVNPNNVHLENHSHLSEQFEQNVELDIDKTDVELAIRELKNYKALGPEVEVAVD